jgi:hypothetical protein
VKFLFSTTIEDDAKKKRPSSLAGGPLEVKRQNGIGSLMPDESSAASEPDAAACGSGSSRSSLRTTSARIDHEVIFAVLAFLLLPFGCSYVEGRRF